MASTDNIEDNTGFAEKNNATFPILADPEKSMSGEYGVLSSRGYARRWTYYIDADGIIVHIDKSVSPASAGADLVKNLEELSFPKTT